MKTLALSLLGILAVSMITPVQAVDYLEEAKKHRVKRDPQEQQQRQSGDNSLQNDAERRRMQNEMDRTRWQLEEQKRQTQELQRQQAEAQRQRMRGNR